ncbi:recombinase family protein [Spirillospora sp. CA-128828]|uniref:recombinase family protein n=1 Tax=Spirillospora sp. CA-128828 TaxID=3240033 RepID=UPI003D910FB8
MPTPEDLRVHVPECVPVTAEYFPLGRGGLSYWLILDPHTFSAGGPVVAGGYARISRDEDRSLRGISKQITDVMERADELCWPLSRLYVDDDLTAAKYGVVRPAFEQLMSDLAKGVINAVITWKSDRFARLDYDLARVFREHGLKRNTKHGGIHFASKATIYDLDDPATHQRLTLEISIIGTGEVSAMRERQTREHARKASAGQPTGGRRGFGYQATPEALAELREAEASADKLRIDAAKKRVWYELRYRQDPREAKALRDARRRVLAGEKLTALAREWNEAGLLTPLGRLWTQSVIKAVLTSPRLAGYRIYRGEIAIGRDGKPVFVEGQDPVFTVAEHEEIVAYLAGRSTSRANPAPGQRRFLLASLLRCGVCKGPMYGNVVAGYSKATKTWEKRQRRVYRCSGDATSCGKMTINADRTDEHVIELVARHIDELSPAIVPGDNAKWDGEEELADAISKRDMWADKIDSGETSESFGMSRVAKWENTIKELRRQRQTWQRTATETHARVLDSGNELRALAKDPATIDRQRAIIDRYVTGILVRKLPPKGPKFQPERLVPLWLEQES